MRSAGGAQRMPYISDAERERARWMTLAEAVAHVEERDRCDRHSALQQLCNALGDRKVRYKFEDLKWFDMKPEHADFWQQPRTIWPSDYKVFDPYGFVTRTVLVYKDDIFKFWPELSVASAGSRITKAGPTTKAKRRRGRPPAEIEVHQAIDRLVEGGRDVKRMLRKKLVALVEEECGKRWKPRAISTHILTWLERHLDT
jgi:hypothetical protein